MFLLIPLVSSNCRTQLRIQILVTEYRRDKQESNDDTMYNL